TFLNMAVLGLGVWLTVTSPITTGWGGWTWTIEPITIGQLTILMSYYGIIAGSVGGILGGLPSVAAAGDAINSLSQLYAEEDQESDSGRREVTALRGEVTLRDVRFRYRDALTHSLDGLNIDLPA